MKEKANDFCFITQTMFGNLIILKNFFFFFLLFFFTGPVAIRIIKG